MNHHDLLLILTHDDAGHPILFRVDAGSEPVTVARWPCRANRCPTLRRRWLRELHRAEDDGLDVLAVEAMG